MTSQEGTVACSGIQKETSNCIYINQMLGQITDKWTLLVIRALRGGPLRFNVLRRELGTVSQKVLTGTLRSLEETGFVSRTVTPVAPVRVDYALTDFGREFLEPVETLSTWVVSNIARIEDARSRYAASQEQ
ncbi:transcriptional regulator, HxlR family [Pseudoxanthomonas sp. GM95]|uniref:winged helix-turn-helix transcriptional regulator n=1 Tax=Pseudoxanthomonas sp. GM95 TaxID=1881043 RepID=UPI0008CCF9F9|nr:helix-turn-helix domain-containing protein [Pseudoxanthomonas sp. GM95]SEL57306.1 transcriptional regulator, HxlR family [Pseudoxanthomonas sp. GM95]